MILRKKTVKSGRITDSGRSCKENHLGVRCGLVLRIPAVKEQHLWLGLNPWPGNFCMLLLLSKKKKKKKKAFEEKKKDFVGLLNTSVLGTILATFKHTTLGVPFVAQH